VNKGESVRDTIETIEAMGLDAVIVRHHSSGVPAQIARWTDAVVVNAGDGWHQHPTQALIDAYTARSHLGDLAGRRIAIVGDVKHSRVARSNIEMFTALGAEVTLVEDYVATHEGTYAVNAVAEVSAGANASVRQSRRVPPQLVLGAEVGVDITDRLNLSVLGAPNRSDVAPQFTLNYKASEALNLEAFVDTLGSWGTQLRLLIRF
jgi:ornithine carbamoyltransferase